MYSIRPVICDDSYCSYLTVKFCVCVCRCFMNQSRLNHCLIYVTLDLAQKTVVCSVRTQTDEIFGYVCYATHATSMYYVIIYP